VYIAELANFAAIPRDKKFAKVRRCRLIVSKPVLKAPMVSALETTT